MALIKPVMTENLKVEVAYGEPGRQALLEVEVPEGTTVAQAIERSGIREQFPGLEIDPGRVGIFSRKVGMDQVLKAGDRVEIYRPLLIDPKEARRACLPTAARASAITGVGT